MSESPIDLNQLKQEYAVEIKSIEHVEERTSRLQREEADAYHERMRASAFFGVCLVSAVVVGGVCMYVALSSNFAPDQQKWAGSIVTLLIGAVAGYLTGKNTK